MSASAIPASEAMTKRWWQLGLGLLVMMSISSPQYTWTLFTGPLTKAYNVQLSTVQITFTLLIVFQTFLSPFQAYLVERFGPRALISLGALMSGAAWVLSADAPNIYVLYLVYGVIGGIGTGIVYIGVIGLMVRWFPDRRGFAAGMVAAGYGMGAILTTYPITDMVKSADWGYAKTLLVWGVIQAAVGLPRGPGVALAAYRIRDHACPAGAAAIVAQLHARGDAAKPDLLPALHHDDDDVDRRPHGRFQRRRFRQAIQCRRRDRLRHAPRCRCR